MLLNGKEYRATQLGYLVSVPDVKSGLIEKASLNRDLNSSSVIDTISCAILTDVRAKDKL
jgi:hypothetical protein